MSIVNQIIEMAISQIPLVIAITWKAAAEKAAIYKAIDCVKDNHDRQISLLDKTLELHIQDSRFARSSLEEKITGQGQRFGPKIEKLETRLNEEVFQRVVDKLDKLLEKG